jgi:hypothetical protein
MTMTEASGNFGPGWRQAHEHGGVKQLNGILSLPSRCLDLQY